MSYKERLITSVGYSRLETEAEDGVVLQRDLEEHKTINGDGVYIPFHAVDRAVITKTMVEREDRNPYGCTPGGGVCVACEAKVCEGCAG